MNCKHCQLPIHEPLIEFCDHCRESCCKYCLEPVYVEAGETYDFCPDCHQEHVTDHDPADPFWLG